MAPWSYGSEGCVELTLEEGTFNPKLNRLSLNYVIFTLSS